MAQAQEGYDLEGITEVRGKGEGVGGCPSHLPESKVVNLKNDGRNTCFLSGPHLFSGANC